MNLMRTDIPLYSGNLARITFFLLLLLISVLTHVGVVFAQSQTTDGQFPKNIIVSSDTDTTPNPLKLLATQQEGAAVQEVSDFSLDTTDNITAQPNSQLLVFVSDSSVGVIAAKAGTTSGQIIDLVPSASQQATNSFSLANLREGVYTLDIMTQKGNIRAAYEGILEIGQQPPTTTAASSLSTAPTPSLPPTASPVASPPPSTESSDSVDNGDDGGGDEDNGDEDNGDTGNQDEDNENGGDDGG